MQVHVETIDSEVLGKPVLTLRDLSLTDDFAEIEKDYVERYQSRYVGCKVPVGDIQLIHRLEDAGFRMVEMQISGTITLRSPPDTSHLPYVYEKVTDPRVLSEIMEIAGKTFDTDRFYNDPEFGPVLSGRRYEAYVKKSFNAADEDVYRLFDPKDGKTLAFKTYKIINDHEVYGLLGGVHPDEKGAGIGLLVDNYADAALLADGRRRMRTAISAANTIMIRYFVGTGKLKVDSVNLVLRKVYSERC